MSQKIKCLNEENVRLLCSFINKAFSKDEIIDDINIKSDGVFSSYYTTNLLQQLKTDNENYTNTIFGKLTHLTCEETNILPTLDNTEVNTLYLYSATSTAPYQQYLKISDGTTEKLIDLGTTSITLSEYMKAIDIANTYTTKIETQAIIDTIGSPSDLETTAKDTLVSAINEIKEGLDDYSTKENIVTTLDDTVTDEQVASALLTKTELDKVNASLGEKASKEEIKNFKNVHISPTTLGITIVNGQDNTRKVFDALGVGERYQDYWGNSSSTSRWGIAESYGNTVQIEIVKVGLGYGVCNAITNKGITLQRYIDTSMTKMLDWQELATMDKLNHSTVDDVSKTLTPLFPSVVKVASGGVTITYIVRNGWCNVNFKFNITSSTTFSWTDIAWGLPIPANSVDTVLRSDGKATQPIPIKITSTGSVSSKVLSAISTTDWWTGNITYPVAE